MIVGGGTAGCVLANRFSADPEVKVLLLEAGGRDDWIWIQVPGAAISTASVIRAPTGVSSTEPDEGLNGRSIIYARGKVLGGCSSINAMVYMRGQARDYDEWAAAHGDSRLALERRCCRFSNRAKTITAAPTTRMERAASGASSSSGCRGRF